MREASEDVPTPDAPGGIDVTSCRSDARGAMATLLRFVPLSLAVREIIRMRALADTGTLSTPLLDVGCGDGLFWEVLARDIIRGDPKDLEGLVGIDINAAELELASARLSPIGGDMRFLDVSERSARSDISQWKGKFRTIIANCSLEHVPRLEGALENIRDMLAPDGVLFLFVPAPGWTNTLWTKRLLAKLGARPAETYAGMVDGFFQHHHLYPGWVWRHLLEGLGFRAEMWGLGSDRANRLYELWMPPAILSFVYKSVFKHYPVRLTAPIKARYLSRMSGFLSEIEHGETNHADLEHPAVQEYCIRCTLAS